MKRRRFIQIVAATALSPGLPMADERRVALGAEARLTLHGAANVTGPARAAAWTEIARMERLFSLYDPHSALSRLNRTGHLDNPADEMLALFNLCTTLHHATDGRFDPTVQPLWRALADGGDIRAARKMIGWDRVRVTPERISLDAGQAVTLNGIAQGFATDRVATVLREAGLTHALVEIGEFRALGGPFRLGLADPDFGELGKLTLNESAVATSSPGALRLGGAAHILDPLGQHPATWSTVTVSGSDAALCDGLSTALCLADMDAARAILSRIGGNLSARVVSRSGDLITL